MAVLKSHLHVLLSWQWENQPIIRQYSSSLIPEMVTLVHCSLQLFTFPNSFISIDLTDNETFRVGGVLVKVTPLTIISDDDSDQRLKLADLNGSYELEVDGIERTSASGVVFLEAFRIERDDDDSEAGEELEFELTGELTEVSGTVFSILGIEIETSGAEFDDTSRDALEDALNAGQRPLLEIEYSGSASSDYIAEEIELAED